MSKNEYSRLMESRMTFKRKVERDYANGSLLGKEFALEHAEYEELKALFDNNKSINTESLQKAFKKPIESDPQNWTNAYFAGFVKAMRNVLHEVDDICGNRDDDSIPF